MKKDIIYREDAIEAIRRLPNAGIHWYISAEAVLDVLFELPSAQPEASILTVTVAPDSEEIERFVREIKDAYVMALPSAQPDVHDRKVGKWIYLTELDAFECSICGGQMVRNIFDYCPWCGSKMKGDEDE